MSHSANAVAQILGVPVSDVQSLGIMTTPSASDQAALAAAGIPVEGDTVARGLAIQAKNAANTAVSSVQSTPNATAHAPDRTALALLGTTSGPAYLSESGREGEFVFDSSNLAGLAGGDTAQGIYVTPSSAPTGASGAWVRKYSGAINAAWFGYKGDAKRGVNGTATAGSTNFIGTTGFFPSDVGKVIAIKGAGPSGSVFVTTIAAYVNANNITLAAAPSTSVTGLNSCVYVYGTDDTAAIQAAVDYAIYLNQASNVAVRSKGDVYIPDGISLTTDVINLGYGDSYHNVPLRGAGMRYGGAEGQCGTAIMPIFTDRPCVAVNGGRNTCLKDISLIGFNYEYLYSNNFGAAAAPTIDDTIAANWIDPALSANAAGRYTPFCGVAIDPYAGTAPTPAYPNRTYPAWLGYSTQYNAATSSNTLLENVEIRGFVVGVANQPCNADGNGDFTKLKRCAISYCQFGLSVGNTQSRLINALNSQIVNVYACVATNVNGKQLGKPSILFDSCSLSNCTNIHIVPNTAYGAGLTFRNCYGEVIWRLGDLCTAVSSSNCPVKYDACEFQLDRQYRGVPQSLLNASGGCGVTFSACSFVANVMVNNYHFMTDPTVTRFENCYVAIGNGETKLYRMCAINGTCGITFSSAGRDIAAFNVRGQSKFNLNTGANLGGYNFDANHQFTNRQTCLSPYAKRAVGFNTTTDGGVVFRGARASYGKAAITNPITQSGKIVTIDMTGTAPSNAAWGLIQSGGEVGDVMIDDATNTVFFVQARTGIVLTLEAQNNLDKNGNLNVTITNATGTLWALNCRMFPLTYNTQGTFTSGNATISNVARSDNYGGYLNDVTNGLQANDYVFGGNGADGNVVTTVTDGLITSVTSGSPGSIVMHSNATVTGTQRLPMFIRAAPANNT